MGPDESLHGVDYPRKPAFVLVVGSLAELLLGDEARVKCVKVVFGGYGEAQVQERFGGCRDVLALEALHL